MVHKNGQFGVDGNPHGVDGNPQVIPLSQLELDDRNANRGTDRGRGMLDKSLKENKAGRSILVDKHGKVIAGNKTVESAAGVGIHEVMIVPSDGTFLVAVQRTDLDLDTDPEARALAYADNRVAELDLDWDPDMLMEDVNRGVDLGGYFHADEIDRLVKQAIDESEEKTVAAKDASNVGAMALQPFEHYDYVMLVFRNTMDWQVAVEFFGIDKASFDIGKGRRKVGMCRVIDGARALELCKSSSQARAG